MFTYDILRYLIAIINNRGKFGVWFDVEERNVTEYLVKGGLGFYQFLPIDFDARCISPVFKSKVTILLYSS